MTAVTGLETEVIWHDVECGAYDEDLPVWEQLAAATTGPILDLGCGTGRVALHLASRGAETHGVDVHLPLLRALGRRAAERGLDVPAWQADVRRMEPPDTSFALALAPMQLLQLLGGAEERGAALGRIARTIAPGGLAAFAIVEGTEASVGSARPGVVPDVREVDGWIYSSLPLEVVSRGGCLEVRRLRQIVAPDGMLSETEQVDRLDVLDAPAVEREGGVAGLTPVARHKVSQSEMHVASTVVVLRREG